MKIALIGYGKMGQEVEKAALASSHTITSISLKTPQDKLDIKGIKSSDVVIDFTAPVIVIDTLKQIAPLKKNIVMGTTGWYEDIDKVKKIVNENGIGFIYGQNFSIGANIFFKIVEYASALTGKFEDYDVYGSEVHHSAKIDSPSGTAKKISEIIIKNFPSKKTLLNQSINRKIEKHELHFASVRAGSNPGFHEVIFDSPADEIKLNHSARGRMGFASGAVRAAEFIYGKKGFYHFDELFK